MSKSMYVRNEFSNVCAYESMLLSLKLEHSKKLGNRVTSGSIPNHTKKLVYKAHKDIDPCDVHDAPLFLFKKVYA